MDEATRKLSVIMATKVRPRYLGWLRRDMEAAEAYSIAYDEIVELVSQKKHMTVDKVRFAYRETLQEAMDLVTR